jgi:glycosyltransferase involved in cell wall biosynthesis
MKLCYFLPQYFDDSAENFYHIGNFLGELGKKVELYLVIEHANSEVNIPNLEMIYVLDDGSRQISHTHRLVKLISIYFQLYKKGVSIFFARSSLTSVIPLILANRFLNFNRTRVVFWSCGQDVVPLSLIPSFRNIKRLISKILSWFAFKGINYLATGPELMVDYYHAYYKVPRNKILTLYNDISLDRFYPLSTYEKSFKKNELLNTDKKIMLFVHTFNKSRGADILPKMAQEIKNRGLNVVILVIGRPGDYSIKLKKIIEKKQLHDNLINLGKVSNKDISKFYQIADLFIMPSRGEGFPRVLLEAMACACPAIAFDVGGVSNILAEKTLNNLLIDKKDDKLFLEKSLKIINDDLLLQELSEASYKKVKDYSTNSIVKMYIDCLNQIQKV